MTIEAFTRDWVPYRDAVLDRFPALTDGDLTDADGSTAALAKRIAEAEGVEPADAQDRLHALLEGPMPADAYADPTRDNESAMDAGAYVPEGEDPLADDRRFGDDTVAEPPIGRDR